MKYNRVMLLSAVLLLLALALGCQPGRPLCQNVQPFGSTRCTGQFMHDDDPELGNDPSRPDHETPQWPDPELCSSVTKLKESKIFVTRQTHPSDFGSLGNADLVCQAAAEAAQLPGQYVAWLAQDGWSPANRAACCSIRDASTRFLRTDGQVLADSWDELINDPLTIPLYFTQYAEPVSLSYTLYGEPSSHGRLWTNATQDGWTAVEGEDCDGWTSTDPDLWARVGSGGAFAQWSDGPRVRCNVRAHFLCVEVGMDVFLVDD